MPRKVWNLVANYAYDRSYRLVYPEVVKEVVRYEAMFMAEIKTVDARAHTEYNKNKTGAVAMVHIQN